MKMHLKMSSEKWRPFCLGLNVVANETSPLSWQIRIITKGTISITIHFITDTSLLSIYELKLHEWRAFILLMEFHNHVQYSDLYDLSHDL